MDNDELLRNCSPEFQEQVKQERAKAAEEQAAKLERERAATPDALLQEIKAMRIDLQALPEQITDALSKRLQRELRWLMWIVVAYAIIYSIVDLVRKVLK